MTGHRQSPRLARPDRRVSPPGVHRSVVVELRDSPDLPPPKNFEELTRRNAIFERFVAERAEVGRRITGPAVHFSLIAGQGSLVIEGPRTIVDDLLEDRRFSGFVAHVSDTAYVTAS